eukprot:CAMPEP_0197606704 /NCGR_PEP_ID=MMETSP1326-20131121/45650_1 /TAXON_ID=1155430 /ORGANISM="Genus nov. species nov., Strain RCC2288" /LENGTH=41 /DNA_ID= /DNA_START= /DNA_END= /DNA_ORIENTATION=
MAAPTLDPRARATPGDSIASTPTTAKVPPPPAPAIAAAAIA